MVISHDTLTDHNDGPVYVGINPKVFPRVEVGGMLESRSWTCDRALPGKIIGDLQDVMPGTARAPEAPPPQRPNIK